METPASTLLPADAVAILQRAARTEIPSGQPLARKKALAGALRRVKAMYPQFFKPEKE